MLITMTGKADLDRLAELACLINDRVSSLHGTAEKYPDSRVASAFRDRLTNIQYSQLEDELKKATVEIQRLKKAFEVELQTSQAATREKHGRPHDLAIARNTLAMKEKAVDEERNRNAHQREELDRPQEESSTSIANQLSELKLSLEETIRQNSSTTIEAVAEKIAKPMEDHGAVLKEVFDVTTSTSETLEGYVQRSDFDTLLRKVTELPDLLPDDRYTEWQKVDIDLTSIIKKVDAIKADISNLTLRTTSSPLQLNRGKRPSETSLDAPESSRRRRTSPQSHAAAQTSPSATGSGSPLVLRSETRAHNQAQTKYQPPAPTGPTRIGPQTQAQTGPRARIQVGPVQDQAAVTLPLGTPPSAAAAPTWNQISFVGQNWTNEKLTLFLSHVESYQREEQARAVSVGADEEIQPLVPRW
ncbi:MAG: hypothetical protein Q9180_002921 [Flavoplaca navasiana]